MPVEIAERWFETQRIDDDITLLWEPHVVPLMRCNIWHVRGRDRDLLIDTGMGIASLAEATRHLIDKPVIAVATHTHADHVGGHAIGGHDVRVHARDVARARRRVEDGFALLEAHGLCTPEEVRTAARRVSTSAGPAEAASGADLLVESLPEDLDLKASVLRVALAEAPDAAVATNTSSLSITAIGEAIGAPERTVGTHYLNPPLLMPTVEVIAGERTAQVIAGATRDLDLPTPHARRGPMPGIALDRQAPASHRSPSLIADVAVNNDLTAGHVLPDLIEPIVERLGWRSDFPWARFENWMRANGSGTLAERRPLPPLGHFALLRFRKEPAEARTNRSLVTAA